MRHAVYCATRNLYSDMETAAKSLVANSNVDKVHFLIEDAEFPTELPDRIECHDVSGQKWFKPDGANGSTRFTYMDLMRTVLCHVLPDLDKVVSLDCDTVCVGDVSPLWDIDVSCCYFAATPEKWASSRPGLDYCNIGVMVQNLDLMRECGKADEIADVLDAHYFAWPGQDAMNYLCQGFIGRVPSGYSSCPWVVDDGSPVRIIHYAARNDWRDEPPVRKYRDMTWDEAMELHGKAKYRGKSVLFSSDRPLERAENLKAIWDAYDGPKEFVQHIPKACDMLSPKYSVFVTDCTPQYSQTKGDVKTIFVSHGISGDKLYALDCSEHHRAGCSQVDYAICTTEYSRELTMRQLGLPAERVVATGFPMADRYFGKRKGDGGTVMAKYRRAYLYVPTWRAPGNPPLPRIDWRKLDSMLEGDEIIVVKRHMCTCENLVGAQLEHVVEVGNMEPSVPFLIDCDVVATDYSSILFDGYILGKPSVMVTDGAEAYLESHGMYNEYPGWYGSRATTVEANEEAFLAMLREACDGGMGEVERNVLETVAGECDGHASERVADFIRSIT